MSESGAAGVHQPAALEDGGHVAFDGEGARLIGGRWDRPGTAIVYTSSTLALAALEVFVHVSPSDAPLGLPVGEVR